jgi:hypothetical protein
MQTNKEPDTVLICDGSGLARPSLKQKLSLPASATTSAADGSEAVRWQPRHRCRAASQLWRHYISSYILEFTAEIPLDPKNCPFWLMESLFG